MKKFVAVFAGGGTGGHLYPGIAVARELQKQKPGVEIHFVGSVLDSNTSGDEQAKIVALIEQGHSVALNLSGCSYVSSAGLRVMLYAFKLAKAKSRDVCLVGVSQEVKDVMHMTGFDKFFRFYQTLDELSQP